MKELLSKIVKRLKCKHKNEVVAYSGLCIVRYKCKECGKSRLVNRFEPRL